MKRTTSKQSEILDQEGNGFVTTSEVPNTVKVVVRHAALVYHVIHILDKICLGSKVYVLDLACTCTCHFVLYVSSMQASPKKS